MRIRVQSDDTNFKLWLPSAAIFNLLSAAICAKVINSKLPSSYKVPYSQMRKFFKAMKKCRHVLQGQPIFSVCNSSGEKVEIWI